MYRKFSSSLYTLGLIYLALGGNSALSPPPPPSVSTYNSGSLRVIGNVDLNADAVLNVIFENWTNGSQPVLNLRGYVMTVDSGGIAVNASNGSFIHGPGYLTTSQDFLDIKVNVRTASDKGLNIESVIVDNGNRRIGLRVSGNRPGEGVVFLTGSQSNRFTGNVEISGRDNYLALGKKNGAIAVRGDIFVKNGAVLNFTNSNQTLKTSSVFLNSSRVILYSGVAANTSNSLKKLTVEGNGVIAFDHTSVFKFKKYLYLDDLLIRRGGSLTVTGWLDGQDFLLVRKDSKGLAAALKKIDFQGYNRNNIHLVNFNKEYWEISAAPEPATYGVILGAIGLGVVGWRRQRRTKLR